jgi:hypothetical protein
MSIVDILRDILAIQNRNDMIKLLEKSDNPETHNPIKCDMKYMSSDSTIKLPNKTSRCGKFIGSTLVNEILDHLLCKDDAKIQSDDGKIVFIFNGKSNDCISPNNCIFYASGSSSAIYIINEQSDPKKDYILRVNATRSNRGLHYNIFNINKYTIIIILN